MGRFSLTEILLIVLAIALIFGASKLPQLARAMGDSIKEFKKSVKDEEKEKRG